MSTDLKNKVLCIGAALLLLGVMLANVLSPQRGLSITERRRFSSPVFSAEKLISGKLALDYEKYALEQFVLRDQFRHLKALSTYLSGQRENNGIHLVQGGLYRLEPVKEQGIHTAATKFNQLYDTYLQGLDVYWAVIPDKAYYLPGGLGLPLGYERMLAILQDKLASMDYIDLFPALSQEDYYRTDSHWRQERLIPVADLLLSKMGRELARGEYGEHELHPFYGSYYGRSGLLLPPDTIIYLSNETLARAEVYDQDGKDLGGIYNLELFASMDPYNFFLSGPTPIITMVNPDPSTDRELIIFRDSYASSLAPLLLERYAKVHLVDLRYITSNQLEDYLEFGPHQDVLLLYSVPILNNSSMLKIGN